MADLTESIRTWLNTGINDATVHTGEDVPQQITGDFVWFMRSGETVDDNLNGPQDIISASIDVEIVSTNLDACRTLTEKVKYLFRSHGGFTITFTENSVTHRIAGFDVENHDDSYLPHLVELDEKLHIGSFNLTAFYG